MFLVIEINNFIPAYFWKEVLRGQAQVYPKDPKCDSNCKTVVPTVKTILSKHSPNPWKAKFMFVFVFNKIKTNTVQILKPKQDQVFFFFIQTLRRQKRQKLELIIKFNDILIF